MTDRDRSGTPEDGYERRVGRWSRLVAAELVDWLAPEPGWRWLDVGCGGGAVAATVMERAAPLRIVGVDPAKELRLAWHRLDDRRFVACRGAAEHLPFADRTFDVVASGLGVPFFVDKPGGVGEMVRAVRPGGVVAAYVWDFGGGMQAMRAFWDEAIALDPAAAQFDHARRLTPSTPEPLAALLRSAGLDAVETRAIDVPTVYRDFDDFWLPFTIGAGTIVDYVSSLAEEPRARLAERLRRKLAPRADGSIALQARAWAARGRRAPADRN